MATLFRARSEALHTFFATNTDQEFLELVSSTIDRMAQEIATDPYLKPANPDFVESKARKLEKEIREVLGEKDDIFLENDPGLGLVIASTRLDHQSLDLVVRGKHPVERLRLNLSEAVTTPPSAITSYQLPTGEKEVSLPVVATNTGESLVILGGFLPNLTVASEVRHRGTLQSSPGFYRIKLKGLNPNTKILSAEINRGQGWITRRTCGLDYPNSLLPAICSGSCQYCP